ncbi:MAG: hypothetical protein ACHQYQ_06045 [Bacteriovoracales bacterium]
MKILIKRLIRLPGVGSFDPVTLVQLIPSYLKVIPKKENDCTLTITTSREPTFIGRGALI